MKYCVIWKAMPGVQNSQSVPRIGDCSSLYSGPRQAEDRVELMPWPVRRPPDCTQPVNEPIKAAKLDRLRLYLQWQRPYGDVARTADAAKRMGLEWTTRDWGRPKGKPAEGAVKHGQ